MLPKSLLNVFYSLGSLFNLPKKLCFLCPGGGGAVSCHSFFQPKQRIRHQELLPKYLSETDSALILKGSWVAGLYLYLPESHGSPVHSLPAGKDAVIITPALSAGSIWLHAGTMRQKGRRNPKPWEY